MWMPMPIVFTSLLPNSHHQNKHDSIVSFVAVSYWCVIKLCTHTCARERTKKNRAQITFESKEGKKGKKKKKKKCFSCVAFSTRRVRSVAAGARGTVALCASVATAVHALIAVNRARSDRTNKRK
jgi:hypothetical protein